MGNINLKLQTDVSKIQVSLNNESRLSRFDFIIESSELITDDSDEFIDH